LSWEEGGPLVTIEAASNGLACIVTEMGSGGFVSHMNGGLIVEPGDIDATILALQTLSKNPTLLKSLGEQAKSLSADFTWKKVGQSRLHAILNLHQNT
jgi:glycosyltransferase involved in cell wall biosynthesis